MISTQVDTEIQERVLDELRWDARVDAPRVGVGVERGVVTLAGTVDSYAAKLAAQDAAHRVAGVLDVANDLHVVSPGSAGLTDADIARAVRHALEWDVFVPHDRIRSTVTDGWVTLDGTVEDPMERHEAGALVGRLKGVIGMSNDIAVRGPELDPEVVRAAIEGALERRAEREANRIGVYTRPGGIVTLDGVVRSAAEKRAVVGAAEHTRGVRKVESLLIVAPKS